MHADRSKESEKKNWRERHPEQARKGKGVREREKKRNGDINCIASGAMEGKDQTCYFI